ncbi:glycosyltransferase [Chryseosolibacter indicus]|uniref:Glycosyltransferase family 2 protein n=1 Tax=Chryseosolibacter indicus TaxID=2782351 RepID=A0ABS5VNI3_9BACT|nr:glycosyltransferase family 2 protein [Chryseosolibacter indicus]MBT1702578.1 glycosyltransferase family 2 protein [Chryseosolibacter indicus]
MYFIELLLLAYFTYVTLYSFFLSFAALFYKARKAREADYKSKIAVLIPAYKEDGVIVDVASQALKQNYPGNRFDVVVVADSLKPATLVQLRRLPITVVEVSFDKSTKVRALNKAMETLGDTYECAVILDADNIMEPQFLRKMNNLYALGYKAIQGRRAPKNENTEMALLDGLSETINNFIYRQGNVAVGLSSCINGSGMFFEYKTFRDVMSSMDAVGGFDRELEYKLIEQNMGVYYAKDVVVYDEKVENAEVFEKQRTRWISSQFVYLKKYFGKGISKLFKGNFGYFNATVLRNIQLPRLMNLGLLTFITFLSIVLSTYVEITPWVWLSLLFLNFLAMMFAIPGRLYNRNLLKSVFMVPAIFWRMFLLMFKLKGANKSFIHTPHGHVGHTESKNI